MEDGAKMQRVAVIAVSVICVIIFIACVVSAGISTSDTEETIATLEQQKADLAYQLEQVGKVEPVTEVQVKEAVRSAAVAGGTVAELQNTYSTLPSGSMREQRAENTEKLSQFFSESDINAQTEWYGIAYSSGEGLTWSFESNYAFDADEVEVLWLLKDKDGRLYAYATAVYNAGDEKFHDVVWNRTMLGNSTMGAD